MDLVSTFATHPDKPTVKKKSPVTLSSVSSKSTANTKKMKDTWLVAANLESIDSMVSWISQIETSLVGFQNCGCGDQGASTALGYGKYVKSKGRQQQQ